MDIRVPQRKMIGRDDNGNTYADGQVVISE